MYLLDTNVVFELRKAGTDRCDAAVAAWAQSVSVNELFISVITVMEIQTGILLKKRKDAAQAARLQPWLDTQVMPGFDERILPVTTAIAVRCAALHVPHPRSPHDAFLGATAHAHRLVMVTRNAGDFEDMDIGILDPWGFTAP